MQTGLTREAVKAQTLAVIRMGAIPSGEATTM
jgi:hypothetical protein